MTNLTAIRVAMDNIRTYKGKNLMNQRDDGIQTGIRSAASIAKFEQWVHSQFGFKAYGEHTLQRLLKAWLDTNPSIRESHAKEDASPTHDWARKNIMLRDLQKRLRQKKKGYFGKPELIQQWIDDWNWLKKKIADMKKQGYSGNLGSEHHESHSIMHELKSDIREMHSKLLSMEQSMNGLKKQGDESEEPDQKAGFIREFDRLKTGYGITERRYKQAIREYRKLHKQGLEDQQRSQWLLENTAKISLIESVTERQKALGEARYDVKGDPVKVVSTTCHDWRGYEIDCKTHKIIGQGWSKDNNWKIAEGSAGDIGIMGLREKALTPKQRSARTKKAWLARNRNKKDNKKDRVSKYDDRVPFVGSSDDDPVLTKKKEDKDKIWLQRKNERNQALVDKVDWSNHKKFRSNYPRNATYIVPKEPINISKLNGKAATFYITRQEKKKFGIKQSPPFQLKFHKLNKAQLKDKTYREIRSKLSPITAKHFQDGETSRWKSDDTFVNLRGWVEENIHHFEPLYSFGYGASTSDVLEDVINTVYDVTGLDFQNAQPEQFSDLADDLAQQYDMDHEDDYTTSY